MTSDRAAPDDRGAPSPETVREPTPREETPPERVLPTVPRATYRVQLRNGVDFDAAARVVPYLRRLGVSHLYVSPLLEASPGSGHGYDVVDPARVEPTIGGDEGLARLRSAMRDAGLGEVLDVVPNHMAISGPENPWWWDVLENGPSSRYAHFFDVDWDPPEAYLRNRVLLPILGDHYGRVLEAGDLRLERDGATFSVRYADHRLPVAPPSLDELLGDAARRLERGGGPPDAVAELGFIGDSARGLPPSGADDRALARRRHRDKEVLRRLLGTLLEREPAAAAAIDAAVADLNADPDALDALLRRQNYRLAFWRAAGHELPYRRFFDVTSLVGLCQEDPDVFAATHGLVLEWLARGELDGLRIDHPDGLRDPKAYLDALRSASPRTWLVVEKILEPGERLREEWPVAGTSGYESLNLTGNLFVDRRNEAAFDAAYGEFTGETRSFAEIGLDAKRLILREVLAAELARLAGLLLEICERRRRYRDYTRHDVHEALLEVAACFPIYRTYVQPERDEIAAADRRAIEEAIELAERERPSVDPRLLELIRSILTLETRGEAETELTLRFQQLTGAVMAKGIEDTAFYRYVRLVSRNEVGGDPSVFGIAPDAFHRAAEERQAIWPATMLASSTHDTKRSEDVRARLDLLSEIPEQWQAAVTRLSALAEPHRTGGMPDRRTEWLYYQTLVGAWPLSTERAVAYMEKASREAKLETSWATPNAAYDAALRAFVEGTLGDEAFVQALEAFVSPLVWPGRVTSLAAALLKLTSPGVPDTYQGTELWDLSLVDPDNRRPVDFELRSRLLGELEGCAPGEVAAEALRRADEGLPKLWLVRQALTIRATRPETFGPGSRGSYQALIAHGASAEHLVAYSRGGSVIALAPRLVLGLGGDWGDTALDLPAGEWRDVLTDARWTGGRVPVAELLGRFPVGLLELVEDPSA